MAQRWINLVIVERSIHIEDVIWKPAEGKAAHEDQHNFSQAFPSFHLQVQRKGPLVKMKGEPATSKTHDIIGVNLI